MTRIQESFEKYAKVLATKFEAIRAAASDSDVKGSANEEIISEFFSGCVPSWSVVNNSQILDAENRISDEIDVCVCNQDQFFIQPGSGVLLADGVDFVVQVKAVLTDQELDKIIKNAATVKALEKKPSGGDTVQIPENFPQEWVNRIPYLVFAFSSQLGPATIKQRLREKCTDVDLVIQPDALFVLDRGLYFMNCRDGRGHHLPGAGHQVTDWVGLKTKESTLFEFIRFGIQRVPRIVRVSSPIKNYMPSSVTYDFVG